MVWTVSIILELIPLFTNSYGEDDETTGRFTCYINYKYNPRSGYIFEFVTFFLPLFICTLLQIYFSYQIMLKCKLMVLSPQLSSAVSIISLYPIGSILVWVPFLIVFFVTGGAIKGQSSANLRLLIIMVSICALCEFQPLHLCTSLHSSLSTFLSFFSFFISPLSPPFFSFLQMVLFNP